MRFNTACGDSMRVQPRITKSGHWRALFENVARRFHQPATLATLATRCIGLDWTLQHYSFQPGQWQQE